MKVQSTNPYYHIVYWIFVILVLTLVFGLSWGNSLAAFYFVSLLIPIVLGTSYFFNYFLVPRYFLQKKYFWFGLYTFYTVIVSLYLETIVMMFSFVYLSNFGLIRLGPNSSDSILLAVILYLLVGVGSILLLIRQIREKQQLIAHLLDEKAKMETPVLEIISNRKKILIPYDAIRYIESLSDYVRIHTDQEIFTTKEKISRMEEQLPELFLRIHRSFIVNRKRIRSHAYDELLVDDIELTIGRSYRKTVRERLQKN
jgi:signal transduction histidine kinase